MNEIGKIEKNDYNFIVTEELRLERVVGWLSSMLVGKQWVAKNE